ncbi:MAG: amidase [Chthoniobacteraceae bacterium]
MKHLATRLLLLLLAAECAILPASSARAEEATFVLESATLDDLQQAFDSGAISSVELVTLYLARRALYDQAGAKLNAVVQVNPNVIAEATAADQRRAAGQKIGPLDGVPFVTKDSYNSVGISTTGGVNAWKDIFPTANNFLVTKLKAAGAVLLGHANMDTFANSATNTVSDAFGATLNAYTLGVPAGSSGGPAVATAADFAFFGFGGETGGSIRNPSDRGGIVGFKVGVGTVSVDGVLALVPDRDVIGPMARYTKDEAAIMDVAAVADPTDIWSTVDYAPGRPRASGYTTKQTTASLAGKKFGVIPTYVGTIYPLPTPISSSANTTGISTTSPDILAIFNRARAELVALGATIAEVFLPPDVDTAVALATGNPTRALVAPAQNATNLQANSHFNFLTALGQNPVTRLSQVPGGRVSAGLITAVQNQTFLSFTSPQGIEHFNAQTIYVNKLETWMAANGFDALIWPTHSTKSRTSATPPGRDLVNNMGMPLCTVPMGVIPATGEPTTLAFCGKYRSEADILSYAHAYEVATNYRIPSPLTPAIDGETRVYTVIPPVETTAAVEVASKAPVTRANVAAPIAPTKRTDRLPPVLSITGSAQATVGAEAQLLLRGVALDASGVDSVQVFVNGVEIPSDGARKWTAVMPLAAARKLSVVGSRKLDVLVLAKDRVGNATAKHRLVSLPALR